MEYCIYNLPIQQHILAELNEAYPTPLDVATFNESDDYAGIFEADWSQNHRDFYMAFELNNGVVEFNLDKAKDISRDMLYTYFSLNAPEDPLNLPEFLLLIQAYLNPEDRDPDFQARFDTLKTYFDEIELQVNQIYAATNVDELRAAFDPTVYEGVEIPDDFDTSV